MLIAGHTATASDLRAFIYFIVFFLFLIVEMDSDTANIIVVLVAIIMSLNFLHTFGLKRNAKGK